ncbi:MAG: 3-deoxy-7-phosphoheptulonate synthase, partial [Planctomycetota bacterium]
MFRATDDLRIAKLKPLIPPAILMEEHPLTELASQVVASTRDTARDILKGEDRRLLVIVGPCSIHDQQAAMDYAGRLQEASADWAAELL